MILFSKAYRSYVKEIFYQSIIFFLVRISPLGSLGWKLGVFDESIVERLLEDLNNSVFDGLRNIIGEYIGTIILGLLPFIANIYLHTFLKSDKIENFLLNILFMSIFNLLYLAAWEKLYMEMMYRELAFPIFLTMLFYVIYKKLKLNQDSTHIQ